MNKRIGPIAAAMALAATGLVASGAPSDAAAPAIALSASSVQVGQTITATAPGCEPDEFGGEGPTFSYRRADLVLITITPAGERMAAGGDGGESGIDLTVPGWVDPADPAVVTGRCLETTYDTSTGSFTQSVPVTFADVPLDITPGAGARTPVLSLSRLTAAGGQVISTTGTGCGGTDYAGVVLLRGGDVSGRTPTEFAASTGSPDHPVPASVTAELALNGQASDSDGSGYGGTGGPLVEGDYVALLSCDTEGLTSDTTVLSEPQVVHVVGTNPSGAMMARITDDEQVEVSGEGCSSGAPVTVHADGYRLGSPFLPELNDRVAALQVGDRAAAFSVDDESENEEHFTVDATVTPEADGSWSYSFDAPTDSFQLSVSADCGVATADGFRYSPRYLSEDHTAQIDLARISPTSSPTGGQVTAHGNAYCGVDREEMDEMDPMPDDVEHVLTIQLVDRAGTVLSESPAQLSEQYQMVSGTVTAPSTPGDYFLVGTCDGERGFPTPYEVFAPATLADAAPAPAEPTTGWPRTGVTETYNGRIGPITLPAMDMGTDMERRGGTDMTGGVAHATAAVTPTTELPPMPMPPLPPGGLGPSELFIDVPRPEGDFAITGMSIGLVDAQGNEVGPEKAHLHHFVIGNASGVNPACPGSTFGIPGQIVAAAGAERTVLSTGDGPYGIVVKGSDVWKGVYMLMTRTMTDQQVYLSYDMEYRRDVENVRPLTPYFGSATGCSSFDWPVDGSGTPDVQSTYISIAKDGMLMGTGAHIHNGGSYADMSDDRGRRLCRSELRLKDEVVGHTDMHGGMDEGYPPEFYPDDKAIDGITNCQVHERVEAGERLRFDAVYANDRARSGVMGIYTFYVWEGGGPKTPRVLGGGQKPGGVTPGPPPPVPAPVPPPRPVRCRPDRATPVETAGPSLPGGDRPRLVSASPMLILASGSPRRSELLTTLGLAFEVRPVDIDETPRLGEDPTDLVRRLAVTKAETGLDRAPEIDAVVLGADTVVACDGRILGKPADADEARRMLRTLSGRTHQVHTGVAVASRGAAVDGSADDGAIAPAVTLAVDVASAEVSFATLSDDDIERYVVTGDPFDKAGSYGIQGEAGRFVTRLVGDRDTVVGLSLEATRRLLVGAGLAV